LELRVKDVERNEILVRNGKGQKDRHTMLSGVAKELLPEHLRRVKETHE
jgi:site-specific recombinase XerD